MSANPAAVWPPPPTLTHPFLFLAAFGAAFLLYWIAVVEGRACLSLGAVISLGLLARLTLLAYPPSDDMARYLWEGRMALAGVDPYATAPADPSLAVYRQGFEGAHQAINHPHIPALYPPLGLALFAAVAALSPTVLAFKLAFLMLDLLGLLVLVRALRSPAPRLDPAGYDTSPGSPAVRAAATYFLNPLLILETAGHGHFEGLPILFSLGLLGALRRGRGALAALHLALGAASKVAGFALLPLLLLRFPVRKGLLLALAAAAAAGCAIVFSGSLSTLVRFASRFRHDDWVPFVLRLLSGDSLGPRGEGLLSAALLMAAGLLLSRMLRGAAPERQALGFLGLFLAFSPTVHPWYVLWLLPFAATAGSRP
ncbi:MAG TPA: glycosyltransferase 87 family protein, partial [Fibrobacteria bacterium]|nr:glycosyltransferase 87 family protein [Fibrobacteria bacterium]